jgi:uncharacterized protein (TIGR00299 family) protein
MTLALIDCPTGLAGDMLLAALFDLGVDEAVLHRPMEALGLAGSYRLEIREAHSGGLRGLRLRVHGLEEQPPHRHWSGLRRLLLQAPLEERLRQRVLAVFELLAEVEAAVHGQSPETVHFHEVGALDALVDIVGVCAALLHLGVERLECTVPPAGHGSVQTAHGRLPLPAPAVLEIARRRLIPLAASGDFPAGELTTPTGLALMACWADRFGPPPTCLPRRIGVGLGTRVLDRPNLLRCTLATPWPAAASQVGPAEQLETVLQQQCQIDDASGEDLAFLQEELRRAGALEVFSQPVLMKKGRLGTLITALAWPEQSQALRRVWWRHSGSLGVRESLQPRWVLERRSRRVVTPLGEVGLKRADRPDGGVRVKIEHGDLAALARRHGVSLAEIRRSIRQALTEAGDPWFQPPPLQEPSPPTAGAPNPPSPGSSAPPPSP